MGITATERQILEIIKDKDDVMSMKELSAKSGFEIDYTYMLCRSLEKQGYIDFFTATSCGITVKGKRLIE